MSNANKHFDHNGHAACGRDSKKRAGRRFRIEMTSDIVQVMCGLCERTTAFKAASAAHRAKQEAEHADLRAAGFDPYKPACEMTDAEVEAFIAWKASKSS